ncbi:hypothetical protein PPL_10215 [Heterostelium album PN500]|uniref:Uncharacterized protein n=1 Tax=Heterostelium pallidum (strain ATCC 26659 / Pp 5 / PN500) TaxID=670386 RepID=D3BQN0_HETP5|nr:hypothetical protein PPL_10215 [Heterostelium album PN500]EFA76450.1 hypothetical protein PPL_10215 [Heterostelium album PN500]|eukprot:XP_020428582.1 hypothetical protein PPL_10215 [Heterostelium album PN500]
MYSFDNAECSGDVPSLISSPSGGCIGNVRFMCDSQYTIEEFYYLNDCLLKHNAYKFANENCSNSQTFNCTTIDGIAIPSNSFVTEIYAGRVEGCSNDQDDILQFQSAPLGVCVGGDTIYTCNSYGVTVQSYAAASNCQGQYDTSLTPLGCSHGNSMMKNYLNVYCTN